MARSPRDEDLLAKIVQRLDVLIALELERPAGNRPLPVAHKVDKLANFGLSPAEIGGVLRKSTNYVTATIHQRRKAVRKGKVKHD